MTVKEKLLSVLEENRGTSLSGQKLAEEMKVSRAAVWKAMKKLEEEGYQIQAVNNQGYTLLKQTDVLSEEGIRLALTKDSEVQKILVCKEIDSTNQECKRLAIAGEEEGTVVVSDYQTAGKGRMGRSFYSPAGTGIYMSILLKPKMSGEEALRITTAAAVAVARAIRNVCHKPAMIKWVNDIYINEKKVCGILTEAISDFEMGGVSNVILGIGVNYREPKNGYPEDIRERITSLATCEEIPRNVFVAAVLNEFFKLYGELSTGSYLADYRAWSWILGQKIRFCEKGKWSEAKAIDIDEAGGLIVEEHGMKRILRTGEVTVRRQEN